MSEINIDTPFGYSVDPLYAPKEFLDLSNIDNPKLEIDFTNHKNIRSTRIIKPLRRSLWFGSITFHPEPQWFLHAWDLMKNDERDFPVKNIHSWKVCDGTSETTVEIQKTSE